MARGATPSDALDEALERRQDGVDARHDVRMDRRELRSDFADSR
ncbi:MAG: hypothetical protein QOE70_3932 [Chthoniobacter sp.]|jgi:hypothetical protein|nr:hypothetical protein [Chthoniobacter sp.]